MTLIKTSLLNGIAVMVKMLAMLGINKVLAIYVGPTGYAALGQFQNAIQIITQFASGAVNTGVVKYTAELNNDTTRQHSVWITATGVAVLGASFCGLGVFIFQKQLALLFLHDAEYAGVFTWFAIGLLPFVLNSLLLAVLNGKKEIGRYVVANISGSVISLFLTTILVRYWGLYGAFIALGVYQSIAFGATFVICVKSKWFRLRYFIGRIDWDIGLKLFRFAAMALTSAACAPLAQIVVRQRIGAELGWDAAGYWEAMWRVSAAYMMLLTTTLSVYFLPRLAELVLKREIIQELKRGYAIILPATLLVSLVLYIVRAKIVDVLFAPSFAPMADLFLAQLIGDVLKIGGWILGYLMLAKALVKIYIITEMVFTASFICLSNAFLNIVGLQGVVIAYAVNYALYWFVLWIILRRSYFEKMHA